MAFPVNGNIQFLSFSSKLCFSWPFLSAPFHTISSTRGIIMCIFACERPLFHYTASTYWQVEPGLQRYHFLLMTVLYVGSFCILSTVTHVSFRLHSLWNHVYRENNCVSLEFSFKTSRKVWHTRHNWIAITTTQHCDWWHHGAAGCVGVLVFVVQSWACVTVLHFVPMFMRVSSILLGPPIKHAGRWTGSLEKTWHPVQWICIHDQKRAHCILNERMRSVKSFYSQNF